MEVFGAAWLVRRVLAGCGAAGRGRVWQAGLGAVCIGTVRIGQAG